MSAEAPTFDWTEAQDAILVRLPATADDRQPVGCALTILIAAVILAIPAPIAIVCQFLFQESTDPVIWLVYGVGMIVALWFLRYALISYPDGQLPRAPMEPSLVSVSNGVFKIERAGRARDMDISWEVSEIADVRICVAAPEGIFLGPKSLLKHALAPDELVRISVERVTGDVDDIIIRAPGRHWSDALETRLRAYLGLSSPA